MNYKPFLSFIIFSLLFSCNNYRKEVVIESKTLSDFKIVDLSHDYSDETIYWVTAKEFELEEVFKGDTGNGYYYSANNFETAEHGGTHIDAPIHFAENGLSVDELPR